MRAHDAFFFGTLFFLLGILAASVGIAVGRWAACGSLVLAVLWYVRRKGLAPFGIAPAREGTPKGFFGGPFRSGWGFLGMAALLFFIPAGALYYAVDNERFNRIPLPEGERMFRATVVNHPVTRDGMQEAVLALGESELRVLTKLPAYLTLSYGDALVLIGRVEEPLSDSYRAYLAKERVRGVMAFPEVVSRVPGGWSFRGALYGLLDRIVASFRSTLPAREAALMAGLTVGVRDDFSEDFRDAMAKSGTTHLVALSGYNISVVVLVTMSLLLLALPRRLAFFVTIFVVVSFVIMTGAEASVVRAAIMGGIALLAEHLGRQFSVRNAIVCAGAAMVLANPKVLVFDLGFQLSFLALLGIIYLKPALSALFGWRGAPKGILSWRENFATTAAAQLAVAPLLIHSFGSVSLTSLAANLLVLEVVPLTMGFGFVLAACSFVSLLLAKMIGLIAFLLLRFQTFTIEFFSSLAIPVAPELSLSAAALYYAALLVFIVYVHRAQFSHQTI